MSNLKFPILRFIHIISENIDTESYSFEYQYYWTVTDINKKIKKKSEDRLKQYNFFNLKLNI